MFVFYAWVCKLRSLVASIPAGAALGLPLKLLQLPATSRDGGSWDAAASCAGLNGVGARRAGCFPAIILIRSTGFFPTLILTTDHVFLLLSFLSFYRFVLLLILPLLSSARV